MSRIANLLSTTSGYWTFSTEDERTVTVTPEDCVGVHNFDEIYEMARQKAEQLPPKEN